jgi:hypothetical protein
LEDRLDGLGAIAADAEELRRRNTLAISVGGEEAGSDGRDQGCCGCQKTGGAVDGQ